MYKKLENASIFVEKDAEFECYCNRHYKSAVWTWRGKSISQSQPGLVEVGCEGARYWLKILNCQKDYADKVAVVISDPEDNESVNSEAQLRIKLEQPKFLRDLEDQTVDENFNVKLQCQINEPHQAVIWYFIDETGGKKWIDPEETETFKIANNDGVHSLSFKAKSFWSGQWVCKMDDSDFDSSGIVISNPNDLETTGIHLKLSNFIESTTVLLFPALFSSPL